MKRLGSSRLRSLIEKLQHPRSSVYLLYTVEHGGRLSHTAEEGGRFSYSWVRSTFCRGAVLSHKYLGGKSFSGQFLHIVSTLVLKREEGFVIPLSLTQ